MNALGLRGDDIGGEAAEGFGGERGVLAQRDRAAGLARRDARAQRFRRFAARRPAEFAHRGGGAQGEQRIERKAEIAAYAFEPV